MDDLEKAGESRKHTYARMEALERQIIEQGRLLKAMNNRLEAVEEPVADFNRWRERGVGAVMLISFAAASIGGAFATFGRKLWAVIAG